MRNSVVQHQDAARQCFAARQLQSSQLDCIDEAGVQVFGVSSDDQRSHEQFAKEQKLPFPILADPQRAWITAFGVGTRLGMASRVSFLLDKDGKVAKIYPDVDPAFHAAEVLKDAAALPK